MRPETDKRTEENTPMKILVIKRDKLGDMLLTTPMLAWLRKALPDAEIHVLANDYNAWVLAGNSDFDRIWTLPRVKHAGRVRPGAALTTLKLFWQLRQQEFDWVLVANGEESPRAIRRGLWLGGKNTVSYVQSASSYPKLNHPLPTPLDEHESRRLARLATAIGLPLPATLPNPRYVLPEKDALFARQWLAEQKLQPGSYIVLGLGARRAKKQPTTQQVLDWSAAVAERWGLATVFMWTPGKSDNPLYPGDDEVAEPVLAANSPHIHPFRGPLDQALGLIWHARTSIFPDSGLMHFAAASPGGVLGLFADTAKSPPPSQWAPIGPRAEWVEAPLAVAELPDSLILDRVGILLGPDG